MIAVGPLALAVSLLAAGTPAPTGPTEPITPKQIADSVTAYSPDKSVETWLLDKSVTSLAGTGTSGASTTLTLGTDVLFDFGKDALDAVSVKALDSRLDDIPQRARVKIVGYTDAIGSTSSNLGLSERRARAVARAVTKARPDLKTSATGRGESNPVADNGTPKNDDPAGRAKNRRVELSWPS